MTSMTHEQIEYVTFGIGTITGTHIGHKMMQHVIDRCVARLPNFNCACPVWSRSIPFRFALFIFFTIEFNGWIAVGGTEAHVPIWNNNNKNGIGQHRHRNFRRCLNSEEQKMYAYAWRVCVYSPQLNTTEWAEGDTCNTRTHTFRYRHIDDDFVDDDDSYGYHYYYHNVRVAWAREVIAHGEGSRGSPQWIWLWHSAFPIQNQNK